MQQEATSLSERKRQRLEFIDRHLFWFGTVTKGTIMARFGVDPSTARDDINRYIDLGGRLALQDGRYRALPDFELLLADEAPSAADFLNEEARLSGIAAPPIGVSKPDYPATGPSLVEGPPDLSRPRSISPVVLKGLLRAIEARDALRVDYRSPNWDTADQFWIAPHVLVNDTFRWAVRAWRSDRGRFGDVVLDRIEAIHETKKARHSAKDDAEWQTEIEVRLGPHPGLDPEARRHIEWQYNMRSGRTTVKVRRAMLLYFLKRYQIEEESTRKAPHQQPLFILNRDEVTAALPPWKRVPPEAG